MQNWLYLGKSGCIRAKVVVLQQIGQSGCIRAKWLNLGKSGCYRAKVVLFGIKVVVFGQIGYIR